MASLLEDHRPGRWSRCCSRALPDLPATLALVERLAAELGIQAEVRATMIGDQAAAERARFVGSPTVRVDGRDGDREGELAAEYCLECRLYWHEHRLASYP
jgi:isopentenyldiphosphate isomerase